MTWSDNLKEGVITLANAGGTSHNLAIENPHQQIL